MVDDCDYVDAGGDDESADVRSALMIVVAVVMEWPSLRLSNDCVDIDILPCLSARWAACIMVCCQCLSSLSLSVPACRLPAVCASVCLCTPACVKVEV